MVEFRVPRFSFKLYLGFSHIQFNKSAYIPENYHSNHGLKASQRILVADPQTNTVII